jgi:dTDP-4-amino-4,6-dideoxygalactose transaminase
MNPYLVVEELEKRISEWAGAPYGVAVESCTAAIFLSLQYCKHKGMWIKSQPPHISIPSHTYPGVPCSIIHTGLKVEFENIEWEGEYQLKYLNIWDAALRFRKNMYHGGFQCISGHIKKILNVGRMGMILLDDKEAYDWLKKARFDGRNAVPLKEDYFTQLGWNMYLSPSDAARAIQIFEVIRDKNLPDLKVSDQKYADLSQFKIYTQ